MPKGPGTYGKKVGRPKKTKKMPMSNKDKMAKLRAMKGKK